MKLNRSSKYDILWKFIWKEMGLTQGNAQQKIKTAEDLQPC